METVMFRSLWQYRGFVWGSVLRDFNSKYRESLFGAFWAIAGPTTMIVIYTVVFSQLMRPTFPGHENTPFAFSIYLCAGVIAWSLFAEILGRMNEVFLENGNLIKKANFPRICLPLIVIISSLINFGLLFGIYLFFLISIGYWPGWTLLSIIPLLALQLLLAMGLGVALGTLNVFFRDVGQITGVVLQFWFWLTPIVYTLQALPEGVQKFIKLNPLLPLIKGWQTVFLDHAWPDFTSFFPLMILALLMLWLGAWLFLGRVGELVDEL
ncbi:MAG: ABC transporter permease [Candidatus Competibacter sp.]